MNTNKKIFVGIMWNSRKNTYSLNDKIFIYFFYFLDLPILNAKILNQKSK